jgi:hypothetical protein
VTNDPDPAAGPTPAARCDGRYRITIEDGRIAGIEEQFGP